MTIRQQGVAAATHLRQLTNPRLLPTRCRLFRRGHVLVVRRSRVLMARDHVEVRPDKDLECLSGKLLDHLNHLFPRENNFSMLSQDILGRPANVTPMGMTCLSSKERRLFFLEFASADRVNTIVFKSETPNI